MRLEWERYERSIAVKMLQTASMSCVTPPASRVGETVLPTIGDMEAKLAADTVADAVLAVVVVVLGAVVEGKLVLLVLRGTTNSLATVAMISSTMSHSKCNIWPYCITKRLLNRAERVTKWNRSHD